MTDAVIRQGAVGLLAVMVVASYWFGRFVQRKDDLKKIAELRGLLAEHRELSEWIEGQA